MSGGTLRVHAANTYDVDDRSVCQHDGAGWIAGAISRLHADDNFQAVPGTTVSGPSSFLYVLCVRKTSA